MSYTYEDFVMESAMVEATNETSVDDITMEQWNAEFNVACAAFDAFNKYALIAEYAQCDVDEFVQESLDDKINKVDDWKNSGGKAKKILGTIWSGLLKMIRAVGNFFKNLFSKENNPFAKASRLLKKMKEGSKKNLRSNLEEHKNMLREEQSLKDYYRNESEKLRKENEDLKSKVDKAKEEAADARRAHGQTIDRTVRLMNEKAGLQQENAKLEKKLQHVLAQAAAWKQVSKEYQEKFSRAADAASALKTELGKKNGNIERACDIINGLKGKRKKGESWTPKADSFLKELGYTEKMQTVDSAIADYDDAAQASQKIAADTQKLMEELKAIDTTLQQFDITSQLPQLKAAVVVMRDIADEGLAFGKAAQKLTIGQASANIKAGLPEDMFA